MKMAQTPWGHPDELLNFLRTINDTDWKEICSAQGIGFHYLGESFDKLIPGRAITIAANRGREREAFVEFMKFSGMFGKELGES